MSEKDVFAWMLDKAEEKAKESEKVEEKTELEE